MHAVDVVRRPEAMSRLRAPGTDGVLVEGCVSISLPIEAVDGC